MKYLLDTNVVSESVQLKPNIQVKAWLAKSDAQNLYISVLTLGEIRKGVEKLSLDSRKKNQLSVWLEQELPEWFEDRIIHIDQKIADTWGYLLAHSNRIRPAIDSLLAATAIGYNLALVTRNIADFDYPHLKVFNPWSVN